MSDIIKNFIYMLDSSSKIEQSINVTYPISNLQYTLNLNGVFATPPEWKQTDDDNPNIFTYSARIAHLLLKNGKILSRQLTDKQLKQQQELAAKKKAKKQTKKEEISKQQQEKLRKLRQEQEEQQKKRLERWQKLSQQEKFWETSEDVYKSATLKFENSSISQTLEGSSLISMEQKILHEKGQWVYLFKHVAITEEQIAKLKKGKSKNLNLNDLNTVVLRGWVNYQPFNQPNRKSLQQRVSLQQFMQDQKNADIPKPNVQKTYIKINIELSEFINPISQQPKITYQALIKAPFIPLPIPQQQLCVDQFKAQVKLAIQSIALQFSAQFYKQLNTLQDLKSGNSTFVIKKAQIQKRRQQFLYDFNITGKYKILKQRIKKFIVSICKNKYAQKMAGLNSFTGITTQARDQFYSQLYLFLLNTSRETLDKMIKQYKQQLHIQLTPNVQQAEKDIAKKIQEVTGQNQQQQLTRQAIELQNLFKFKQAQQKFLRIIKKQPLNANVKFQYSKFLTRTRIEKDFPAKIILIMQQVLPVIKNADSMLFLILLLVSSSKKTHLINSFLFLEQLIIQNSKSIKFNLLAYLLFEKYLFNNQLGLKYRRLSEKLYLKEKGQFNFDQYVGLNVFHNNQQNVKYQRELTPEQSDEMWYGILEQVNSKNFMQVSQVIIQMINDKQKVNVKFISSKSQFFRNNIQLGYQTLNELKVQYPSNFEILLFLADMQYQNQNYEEAYPVYITCLKTNKGSTNSSIYLKLGYIQLHKEKWANAKAFFVKSAQLSPKSSLSFLGLGIAMLRINQLQQALKAFKQSNLMDPSNSQPWGYCAIYGIKTKKFCFTNQCLKEMMKLQRKSESSLQDKNNSKDIVTNQLYTQMIGLLKEQIERQRKQNIGGQNLKMEMIRNLRFLID